MKQHVYIFEICYFGHLGNYAGKQFAIISYNCVSGLLERIRDKETVIIAEGYLIVFETRGYLTAGSFVPEVVLEHPELVRQQYEEFVHAGSDVVLALTVRTTH